MSAPILLSAAERDRFAAWLEYEAETDKGMAEQAEKVGAQAIAGKMRSEAVAALIIARKLRQTEDFSI